MPIKTTTIGSYPKPAYVPVKDWFRGHDWFTKGQSAPETQASEEILARGVKEVVEDQVRAGIDIPTDGEVRRENYIHYHCRHLRGVSFDELTLKPMRGGSFEAEVPTVVSALQRREKFLAHDWQVAQSVTKNAVKITVPGPLTICDSVADRYYHDNRKLSAALAEVINGEILDLAASGCRNIQIDEPVFARNAQAALDYGIDNLNRCFHGVPPEVTRWLHICCGYPNKLDNENYTKADPRSYEMLAEALDNASIDVVLIEDAHRHNDLGLLEKFKRISVGLGTIAIARTRVESTEEILERLEAAAQHIDKNRLFACPDCGLAMLPVQTVRAKLKNLSAAAHALA